MADRECRTQNTEHRFKPIVIARSIEFNEGDVAISNYEIASHGISSR